LNAGGLDISLDLTWADSGAAINALKQRVIFTLIGNFYTQWPTTFGEACSAMTGNQ